MKLFSVISLTAAAAAASIYPDGTTVTLDCLSAKFELASVIGPSPPSSEGDCNELCATAHLDSTPNPIVKETGLIGELTQDKYAGCSFDASYIQTSAASFCGFKLNDDEGYLVTVSPVAIYSAVEIARASLSVSFKKENLADWKLYPATSGKCEDATADDISYQSDPITARVTATSTQSVYSIDVLEFYKEHYNLAVTNREDSFYFWAKTGESGLVDDTLPSKNTFYSEEKSFKQFGASPSCIYNSDKSAIQTDCDICLETTNCHWCDSKFIVNQDGSDVEVMRCGVPTEVCNSASKLGGTYEIDSCGSSPIDPVTTTTTPKTTGSSSLVVVTSVVLIVASLTIIL